MLRRALTVAAIIFLVVALDQYTKAWAIAQLQMLLLEVILVGFFCSYTLKTLVHGEVWGPI